MLVLRRPGAAAAAPVLTLNALSLQDAATDPADAYCAIRFNTDGSVTLTSDSGSHPAWLQFGVSENYSIRLDTLTGSLSVGTAGQDLPMNGAREFGVSRTTVGSKGWTGTMTLKRVSDGVTVAGPVDLSLSALVSGSNSGTQTGDFGGGGTGNSGINLP